VRGKGTRQNGSANCETDKLIKQIGRRRELTETVLAGSRLRNAEKSAFVVLIAEAQSVRQA
jgi:hypothetical protein